MAYTFEMLVPRFPHFIYEILCSIRKHYYCHYKCVHAYVCVWKLSLVNKESVLPVMLL